jgi:phage gp36-like protein
VTGTNPSFTTEVTGFAEVVYADPEDFDVFGLPALAGFDEQAIRRRLLSATGRANGFIAAQGVLPLTQPYPDELAEVTCQIASWRLLEHRGFDPESPADAIVKEAHDDAVTWLKDWAASKVQPGVGDQTPEIHEGAAAVVSNPVRGW